MKTTDRPYQRITPRLLLFLMGFPETKNLDKNTLVERVKRIFINLTDFGFIIFIKL